MSMKIQEKAHGFELHHRATRTGFFFHLVRNLAIGVSGLGCLITALGLLGMILILGRAIQIGVEGRITPEWEQHIKSALPILTPAGVLILFGLLMLAGGLLVNWIVTVPVYREGDALPNNRKNNSQK